LELIDFICNKRVDGEAYINVNSNVWKKIVLQYYREYVHGLIDTQGIMEKLKHAGVSFSQPDTIIQYPINQSLEVMAKTLKSKDWDWIQKYIIRKLNGTR